MLKARTVGVLLFAATVGLTMLNEMGAAHAKMFRWDLKDVVFNDGGTASGHFVFDTETNNYPYFDLFITWQNISMPGVPVFSLDNVEMTAATGARLCGPNDCGGLVSSNTNFSTTGFLPVTFLTLIFGSDLGTAGGTVPLIPGVITAGMVPWGGIGGSAEGFGGPEFFNGQSIFVARFVTRGEVVNVGEYFAPAPVPEPSIMIFLALWLAGLIGISRRLKDRCGHA